MQHADRSVQAAGTGPAPDSGGSRDPGVRCRAGRKPRPRSLTCLVSPADASLTRDLRPPDVRGRGGARIGARMSARWGSSDRRRLHVMVTGLVQGVGFRPFLHALAHELGLSGWATNTPDGVLAEVEGAPEPLADFVRRVRTDAPTLADVWTVTTEAIAPIGGTGFEIRESSTGAGRTLVSADVATCPDCVRDLTTPGNRRHRHPFVTCTNCGPRFTIVTALPYDRPSTTMAGFAMCPACAAEYADPADRRFHAQPIACPACGPTLALDQPGAARREGEDALAEAKRMLADGAVLAVKGLGGYHLACDASDASAVGLLRKRKQRGDKPFAVMVADRGRRRPGGRDHPGRARPAHRAPPADRAPAPTGRVGRRGLRRGRPRQSRPRRDDAVHPPAPPAARRPAGARDDQRQRCRRTDRHRRRGSPRAAGGPGRRLAHPRPADPRALRRLGGTRGRRRAAPGPALPGLRAAPPAPAVPDRAGARRGRRRQEHVLSRRRPPGLDVGPRRRHGRLPHPAGVHCRRAAPRAAHRHRARGGGRRRAPVVPLRRLGPHPRRRPAGPPRAAPPRPRRVHAGRQRASR